MLRDIMCRDVAPTDDAIAERIQSFRQQIPKEQKALLNRLLDDINTATAKLNTGPLRRYFFWDYFLRLNALEESQKWHPPIFLYFFAKEGCFLFTFVILSTISINKILLQRFP
jgi:hypothetical protein